MAARPRRRPTAPHAPLTLHGLSVEGVDRCVHCGLCLAYCPTFSELGHRDGLAARAHLPDQVAGRGTHRPDRLRRRAPRSLPRLPRLRDRVSLGRALRPAHRGGARGDRAPASGRPAAAALPLGELRAAAAASRALLRLAAAGLRFYQASGLRSAACAASGLLALLPASLRHWEPLLPELPPRGGPGAAARGDAGRGRPASARGAPHRLHPAGRLRPAQPRDRARAGAERPRGGGPARAGLLRRAARARGRARHRARRSPGAPSRPSSRRGVEEVVVNTSGCGAHMKAYGTLLAGRSRLARARRPASRRACATSPSSSPSSRCAARSGRSREP